MVSTVGTYPLGPGIFAKSGVSVTPAMVQWLTALRGRVPAHVPIVVTDASRTPWTQATAMLSKLTRGEDLRALYKDDAAVDEIVGAGRNPSAMASVIANQVARGRFISRHLTGDALDLRTAGMAVGDVQAVISAARSLGSSTLDESDHLHVERLAAGWFASAASAVQGAVSPSLPAVAAGGGLIAVGGAVALAVVLLGGLWFAFFRR